jgi:hypothetical protein
MRINWSVWELDGWTTGWLVWILFFVVWETLSLRAGTGQELTQHLRPVFLSAPVVWWVFFGLWLWIGVHLLAPAIEDGLLRIVRGY